MEPQMRSGTASLSGEVTTLVSQAAATIMAIRAQALDARMKSDNSPVTKADEAAEAIILDGLHRLMPGVPAVSEEAVDRAGGALPGHAYFLVDPVDGTRELVAGRDEFTVNVAMIEDGIPVFGIVAAPALGLIWRTAGRSGAERIRLAPGAPSGTATEITTIRTRAYPPQSPVAITSRSHPDAPTEAFLARIPGVQRMVSGSSIKLCRVAEGMADIYPRLGRTRQWDLAAGHAVLLAAGGAVTTPTGDPVIYRPIEGYAVPGYIAWGDPSAAARFVTEPIQGDSVS